MNNPGFLTVAGRLILNVHDLNNEGSVGQTTDIRMIRTIDENGKENEAPAVSGRMLKHWHLAYMLRQELGNTNKLCPQCKISEPERKPQDESNGIKACVICDAHGFLCTDKPGFNATVEVSGTEISLRKEAQDDQPEEVINVNPCTHDANKRDTQCPTCTLHNLDKEKVWISGELSSDPEGKAVTVSFVQSGRGKTKTTIGKNPKGLSLRRSSCVNFSWLLPLLDSTSAAKQVIHSRVASSAGEGEEKSSQMIFYKSYASGVYGFVCSIDLARIGKPLIGDGESQPDEITRRRKLAVNALMPVIMGAFGASQSHALPHSRCLGLLAALSENSKPLPNLVSPIYATGFEESISILKSIGDGVKYWGYGDVDEVKLDQDHKKDNIQAVFSAIESELA